MTYEKSIHDRQAASEGGLSGDVYDPQRSEPIRIYLQRRRDCYRSKRRDLPDAAMSAPGIRQPKLNTTGRSRLHPKSGSMRAKFQGELLPEKGAVICQITDGSLFAHTTGTRKTSQSAARIHSADSGGRHRRNGTLTRTATKTGKSAHTRSD